MRSVTHARVAPSGTSADRGRRCWEWALGRWLTCCSDFGTTPIVQWGGIGAWFVFNFVVMALAVVSSNWQGCAIATLVMQLLVCSTQLVLTCTVFILDRVDQHAHSTQVRLRALIAVLYAQGPLSLAVYSYFLFRDSCQVDHHVVSVVHVLVGWLAASFFFWGGYGVVVLDPSKPLRVQAKVVLFEVAVLALMAISFGVAGARNMAAAGTASDQCGEMGKTGVLMAVMLATTAVAQAVVTLRPTRRLFKIPRFFGRAIPCYSATACLSMNVIATVAVHTDECERLPMYNTASVLVYLCWFVMIPFFCRTVGGASRPFYHWRNHRPISIHVVPSVIIAALCVCTAISYVRRCLWWPVRHRQVLCCSDSLTCRALRIRYAPTSDECSTTIDALSAFGYCGLAGVVGALARVVLRRRFFVGNCADDESVKGATLASRVLLYVLLCGVPGLYAHIWY